MCRFRAGGVAWGWRELSEIPYEGVEQKRGEEKQIFLKGDNQAGSRGRCLKKREAGAPLQFMYRKRPLILNRVIVKIFSLRFFKWHVYLFHVIRYGFFVTYRRSAFYQYFPVICNYCCKILGSNEIKPNINLSYTDPRLKEKFNLKAHCQVGQLLITESPL